jgi:hypothetical protein
MLFFLFCEWFELCLVNLHGVVIGCRHNMFGLEHGGMNCVNVGDGSQCFSYQHSKSWLSQRTTCVIVWFKVLGLSMVNERSFTSPQSPNWNWFTSATLSHEMSHVNCRHLEAYIKVGCDFWWRVHNSLVVICSLFEL